MTEKLRIEINVRAPILLWFSNLISTLYSEKILTEKNIYELQRRAFGLIKSQRNMTGIYFFHRLKDFLKDSGMENCILTYKNHTVKSSIKKDKDSVKSLIKKDSVKNDSLKKLQDKFNNDR